MIALQSDSRCQSHSGKSPELVGYKYYFSARKFSFVNKMGIILIRENLISKAPLFALLIRDYPLSLKYTTAVQVLQTTPKPETHHFR